MRDWIVATLAVVFLSGGTTGYLLGQNSRETEVPRTWKDGYLENLENTVPGITAEDLSRARKIIDTYEERVLSLRTGVERLLREQLDQVARESEQQVQAIIDSYERKPGGANGN